MKLITHRWTVFKHDLEVDWKFQQLDCVHFNKYFITFLLLNVIKKSFW